MLSPKFVRKLPFRLKSNFLPWLPPFFKVFHDGLRLLFHFFHKSSHDHSLTLYFLHGSLKFIKFIKENNRHIHITCTPSFHLINRLLDGFPCRCIGEFIRFSICSTRVGTLPSCAASAASNPESGDSTVVLLLNYCGIFLVKSAPPDGPKICSDGFSSGIHQNIQKIWKLVNVWAC